MPGRLQVLDQQALRPFDRDRQPLAEPGQLPVQLNQACDIVAYSQLHQPHASRVNHAQLMMLTAQSMPANAGQSI